MSKNEKTTLVGVGVGVLAVVGLAFMFKSKGSEPQKNDIIESPSNDVRVTPSAVRPNED